MELSKEIYNTYATQRHGLHEYNSSLSKDNRESFSAATDCNSMIGMLGEVIATNKFIIEGYRVYRADADFFYRETYNDINLPGSFLDFTEIKKYRRIDRYICERYQVSDICSRLTKFQQKELKNGTMSMVFQEAKRLSVEKNSDYWKGYPGRIDLVIEKNGVIAFFEVKTNSSQPGDWQKLRILLLQRENILAKIIRVNLNFTPILENDTKEYNVVRIPFKRNFAFGILLEKQNPTSGNLYSVQIPEAISETTIHVPGNEIENVTYEIKLEDVEKLKVVESPDEQYMNDIHKLFISFYGNKSDCGKGQTYIDN